jgi:hypothetical protein
VVTFSQTEISLYEWVRLSTIAQTPLSTGAHDLLHTVKYHICQVCMREEIKEITPKPSEIGINMQNYYYAK